MVRYGDLSCDHEFVIRKGGYEEQCLAVICKKCGAFGCTCDTPEYVFNRNEELTPDANPQWNNPYAQKKKIYTI